ncbi:MAG TPA: DUF58 domain-containing protein [Stellaceae bacterium]|jgi:uncharacterized protein (DUF58 family)|nr:DUF58 domain-containing protein [Stellaceae bacterium]
MRPTGRAVLVFALGVPLALLLVVANPALWPFSFDYGALVLIAIAADLALALPRGRLAATVTPPARLYIGEEGAIAVSLSTGRRYPRPVRFELLAEQSGAIDPPEVAAAELAPGAACLVKLRLVPRRRGRVRVDRLWLRWRAPLGLIELSRIIGIDREIDVLPNIRGIESAALQFYGQEAIFGIKLQQQRGEGTEFDALRDYAPGLDARFIDWKHSARHRKLLCKEFRAERNHPVVLAFDTGYLMREPIEGMPRLDHAINAGLLLAWISLRGGDFVGTYGFDAAVRQYLAPIRGRAAFGRLQQAAAALDYRADETNFTLGLAELGARLNRRALVVLFTEFVDTVTAELLIESMGRMASRHLVVFVTLRDSLLQQTVDAAPERFERVAASVIAQDMLRDRRIVFERLERLGVQCLDVPSGSLAVALINRYLLIKQRGLI